MPEPPAVDRANHPREARAKMIAMAARFLVIDFVRVC
jgi:hypothetical protein